MITWEQLDLLPNSGEIAELLRKFGIRGKPGSSVCPLSRATGWHVGGSHRWHPAEGWVELTTAQRIFVWNFEHGDYPDLMEE